MKPLIRSIQIGKPREFSDDAGRVWQSSIVKEPIHTPVRIGRANIAGDEQADRKHHGGPDKAVLAYSAEHFVSWQTEFSEFRSESNLAGAFGENLTVDGLTESTVCIGDVYTIGTAELQVSQPRQPCWKLSRRWNIPKLAVRVQQTGRTGWYLRVLKEGVIEESMTIELVDRPFAATTVAWASSVMYAKPRNSGNDQLLAACPALSDSWKETLLRRATSGKQADAAVRLYGED